MHQSFFDVRAVTIDCTGEYVCMCVAICSCGSDFVVAEMSVRIH
jgi:hypothetical protein